MAKGKKWNLTPFRRDEIIDMLNMQYNLTLIARHYQITPDVLSQKLVEAEIDYKVIQQDGIRKLKANAYATIAEIEEPEKLVKASLDFLKQYDKSDDVAKDEAKPQVTITLE